MIPPLFGIYVREFRNLAPLEVVMNSGAWVGHNYAIQHVYGIREDYWTDASCFTRGKLLSTL